MPPPPEPTRRVVGAVARRPWLWAAAAGAVARHAPRRWWRGPRAAAPWLRFRLETAYGAERARPAAGDLVTWLRWCRAWPRARR
ncbi:MAG TPA: hypothetical protein VEW93_08490 [Acidimicrobiales bacterium]|nr:hypothetical protein [Acidimicrobiales bacterium]